MKKTKEEPKADINAVEKVESDEKAIEVSEAKPPQRDSRGRWLKGSTPNPTGKGGFGDNPDHAVGRRSLTPKYWRRKFGDMTREELDYARKYIDALPVAARMVLADIDAAFDEDTPAGLRVGVRQDFYDRIDGKATQVLQADVETTQREPIKITFEDLSTD